MKEPVSVLHATAWYPPAQMGGTEVYVQDLVQSLAEAGVKSRVLVPGAVETRTTYQWQGSPVEVYPGVPADGSHAGLTEAQRLDAFADLLKAHPGAIYHQHSWTPDCGPAHLRLARALGHRTVVTVHVPSNVCMRGTMMLFGQTSCDGRILPSRCGACWADGRGASRALATLLGWFPPGLGAAAPGRLGAALSARALARAKLLQLQEMFANADRVVAVCRWLFDALALNGAPAEKLVLSRQGVSKAFLDLARPGQPAQHGPQVPTAAAPLRLLYLGRWHSVKGLAVVIRALRNLPDAPVTLTIHAPDGGPEERNHKAEMTSLTAGDPRIVIRPPLPRAAIPAAMHGFDAMVIPSTWLETGPLVALEAQAAGLFVLGSRLGGIAELIDTPHKGELVTAGDVAAWTEAIGRLAHRRPDSALAPAQVRSMDDAAADMAALYQSLT